MTITRQWADRARDLRRDAYAMYLAANDHRTPWYAKLAAVIVIGYALSPIDLIPDFIPVLGYLDDLILVPLGILLVRALIPADIFAEHREAAAAKFDHATPKSWAGAVSIVAIWLIIAVVALSYLL